MSSICIKNATIVNEGRSFRSDLLVTGEFINKIGIVQADEIPHDSTIIDASGLILIPGVIDDQVHFRDPGLTHKGDIYTESRAAAAGGITSFMDMPNTSPQTVTNDLLRGKMELASQKSLINYSFYLGATNTNLDEIINADPHTVCGIKLFMGSSTGNMLVDNEQSLRDLFRYATIPVACHCESEPVIRNNLEKLKNEFGEDIPVRMHPVIRSREACFLSTSHSIDLADEYGARLHILHLSTADEMKLFRNDIPLSQKKITAEVCVHHLWFDDSDYNRLGNFIKWNPAVKTKYDRDALIESVINDKIDVIATDHAPHTLEEKSNKYLKAPSGGPLVQHALNVMLELWHRRAVSLEKIVEKMCHNPAFLFNIKERGFIRERYKADLCLVDPESQWTVNKDNILYKCGWSPFEGVTFRSAVKTTIVNGTIVYDNGYINENYRGQRLMFDR